MFLLTTMREFDRLPLKEMVQVRYAELGTCRKHLRHVSVLFIEDGFFILKESMRRDVP
jgi:hypothetical protein